MPFIHEVIGWYLVLREMQYFAYKENKGKYWLKCEKKGKEKKYIHLYNLFIKKKRVKKVAICINIYYLIKIIKEQFSKKKSLFVFKNIL